MGTVLGLGGRRTSATGNSAPTELCKNTIGASKIAISGKINNSETATSGGADNVPPWRVSKTSASKIAGLNNGINKKEERSMEVGRIGGGLANRRKGILGLGSNGTVSNDTGVKVGVGASSNTGVRAVTNNGGNRVVVGGTRPQVGVGVGTQKVQPRTVAPNQVGRGVTNADASLQKVKASASKLLGRFLEMAYDLTGQEEEALLEMMEVLDLKDALLSAGGLGTTSPINAQVILDCVDEINQVMACNTAVTSNNIEAANNIYSKLDSLTVSAQSGVYNEPDLVEILAELYIANMINLQDGSKPNLNYCFNTLKNRVLNMCGGVNAVNQRVGTGASNVNIGSVPSGVRTIGTTANRIDTTRRVGVQSTQATPTTQTNGGKLFIRPTRSVSNQFADRGTGLRNGIGSGIRRPIGSGIQSRIGTQEGLRPTGITLGSRSGAGVSRINVTENSRGGSGLLSRRTGGAGVDRRGVGVNVVDRRVDNGVQTGTSSAVMNYINL